MKYLENINLPEDLRKLGINELKALCAEVREVIIEVISKNGGHLAPNLGVVELTVALHYIFNTPDDQIIWDVGHQSYTHKLLTGRRDIFHTLRREGGISGFPKRKESIYDSFDTGHSSTSISASLGFAAARDLKGEKSKVIAVIGDGSMTAGLAFEGLNHAGDLNKDLIVILNDNEMSISPNVGALSAYLNRLMTGKFYYGFRKRVERFLNVIPKGRFILEGLKRLEELSKGLLVPGLLFEELGFTYVGPIDGNNLTHLIDTLKNIKNIEGPLLLHTITKKGKGYKPAEDDPALFHGIGPFDIETGKPLPSGKNPSYTKIFGETLIRLAESDDKIIAISAAMTSGTGLEKFAKKYPDRFFDVGIAEQHAVTFAAGMGLKGFKPCIAVYSTFLQRAYDQILHDVCIQKIPVVFAIDRGGIVGADGETHQGLFDFSYLRNIPNLLVAAPKDERELSEMLESAFKWNVPSAIRYPRGEGAGVDWENKLSYIPAGKGELIRKGNSAAVFAVGATVYPVIEAAKMLEKSGINLTVINARFIKPLDEELLIDAAKRCGNVITIEENVLAGGFGSAVLELIESKGINVHVKRLGVPDEFVEHGSQEYLRKKYALDAEGICNSIKSFMERLQDEKFKKKKFRILPFFKS